MPLSTVVNGQVSDAIQLNGPVNLLNLMRGEQTVTETVLVSGVDASVAENVYVTLTANRVVGAPLNPVANQKLHFVFTQNGTGGWTITWNAAFSLTNWTLNTAANAKTEATFSYIGTSWVLALNPTLAPGKLLPARPFAPVVLSGSPVVQIVGFDSVVGRLIAMDKSFGGLAMTDDYFGTAWKNSKSLPANVANGQCAGIERFAGNYYGLFKDTTSTLWGIYKSAVPALSTNDFAWGAQMTPLAAAATGPAPFTQFCATSTSLLVGEYGDPAGGPSIFRSTDGAAWTRVYGPDAATRHVHAILEDPYNLGTVYATLGDNGTTKSVIRSIDGGATWNTFITSATNLWQSVQLSFSPKWIYLASDRVGRSFAVCDRSGNIYVGASNYHRNLPVPFTTASTDGFYEDAYYGIYDPTGDIYYLIANDTSSQGTTAGLFYQAVPGGRLELIAKLGSNENARPYIGGGFLWFGDAQVALLSKGPVG